MIFIYSLSIDINSQLSLQRGPVAAGEGHAGDLVVLVRHQHPHLRQLVQVLHAVAQGILKLELPEITLNAE